MLGSSAGAPIASFLGWHLLFICVAVFSSVIAGAIYFQRNTLFPGKIMHTQNSTIKITSFINVLSTARARRLYSYVFINGMFHSGIFAWLGYFFYKNYGLNEFRTGLALLGYGIPGLLLGPQLGRLADRYGRSKIMPSGLFLASLTVLFLSQNFMLTVSCILIGLLSLGFDLSHPLFAAIATTLSPQKGIAVGLFAFFLFSGYGFGSLAISLIINIGLNYAFQIYGIILFIAAVSSIVIFKNEK